MSVNEDSAGQDTGMAGAQFRVALAAAEDPSATPAERAEMLMEIAQGLQLKPRSAQQLHDAVALYERALALIPQGEPLLAARIQARRGTALQALPAGPETLEAATASFQTARGTLEALGTPAEVAEIDMNLGVATQALAGVHRARIQDAIAHYHRALRVFTRESHRREFAILHNNLAIAYLSIPASDERAVLRESLAVQSFRQVLEVVTLTDHPTEYAMAQNNLGNALQYAPSSHPLENLLQAVSAYDEALKVRNARDTPLEYANTLANKANALRNLPDDVHNPQGGNARNLATARQLYLSARALFARHGLSGNAALVEEALAELGDKGDFGEPLITEASSEPSTEPSD